MTVNCHSSASIEMTCRFRKAFNSYMEKKLKYLLLADQSIFPCGWCIHGISEKLSCASQPNQSNLQFSLFLFILVFFVVLFWCGYTFSFVDRICIKIKVKRERRKKQLKERMKTTESKRRNEKTVCRDMCTNLLDLFLEKC